jgi:hypothetical protein
MKSNARVGLTLATGDGLPHDRAQPSPGLSGPQNTVIPVPRATSPSPIRVKPLLSASEEVAARKRFGQKSQN